MRYLLVHLADPAKEGSLRHDENQVCYAYSLLEQKGLVPRLSNHYGLTRIEYARRLWRDGMGYSSAPGKDWLLKVALDEAGV